MAVDITGNPYVVYASDEPQMIKEGPCFVEKFVFMNYTDVEHRCRITDRDGRDVFNVRANLQYSPVVLAPGCLPFWDMFLWELDSGQCYIYLK